ncbi:MAG: 2Fe-2S iron-sulfur cluster-binding protein [Candidatus Thermoplasmatota archaeon]|nr:2Fe-2S iron-sulfur cluster-binding protein [Candidatus Thermoplasmatota archaeon]
MTESDSHSENTVEQLRLVRFFLGPKLLGQTRVEAGETIVEHAESADVNIPTNCTSGTCGTCMITLLSGEVNLPEILPPGLDDYMVEQDARLGCIGVPVGDCDIDIRPPL